MKSPLLLIVLCMPLAAEPLPSLTAMKSAADAFLGSLDEVKRDQATFPFADDARENFRFTPQVRTGLPLKEMDTAQRAAAMKLLESVLSDNGKLKATQIMTLEGVLAEADMKKIEAAGIGKIRFAWAGGTKPGEAWYYRVQGPTFLMEAANTQNNANHIHATWRDFEGDFGHDILAEHYHQHEKGE